MPSDEKILKELRDNYDYCVTEWAPIREEARMDMKYRAGDPWDPIERAARVAAGRPCLSLDELNQYLNQCIGDVLQNKRAVKVDPRGNGATDDTARYRQGMIRQIEYKSKAAGAYVTAFDNALSRSYGYVKVVKRYESADSFEQVLAVERVPNPDTIYLDPDAKEADWSDGKIAFEIDSMRRKDFKSAWPKAEITSFSAEHMAQAPAWIQADRVQVGRYWKVKQTPRTLVLMEDGAKVYMDEIPGAKLDGGFCVFPDGRKLAIRNQRKTKDQAVCYYITNGIEILEEGEVEFPEIPIVPCMGREMYVDDGGGSKRKLFSLIRLARDPYMLYCYLRTCEMEIIGLASKTPWLGYEGQFDTATDWANINKAPTAYAEVKATTTATGTAILPLPQRNNFEAGIQSVEMTAEAARRAIQAAMGISALPTAAQRQNEKSGVALQRIQSQQAQGSYQFTDSYTTMIERVGRLLDGTIDKIYIEEGREIGIRDQKDEYSVIKINQPATDSKGQEMHFPTDQGEHDVTISTGPSDASEREQVQDICKVLMGDPACPPKIKALAIKLMNMGPLGDEMAEAFDPQGQQAIPPQIAQKMQSYEAMIDQLTKAVNELQREKDGKVLELASKEKIARWQETSKLLIAELQANVKGSEKLVEIDLKRLDHDHELRKQEQAADLAPEPEPAGGAE